MTCPNCIAYHSIQIELELIHDFVFFSDVTILQTTAMKQRTKDTYMIFQFNPIHLHFYSSYLQKQCIWLRDTKSTSWYYNNFFKWIKLTFTTERTNGFCTKFSFTIPTECSTIWKQVHRLCSLKIQIYIKNPFILLIFAVLTMINRKCTLCRHCKILILQICCIIMVTHSLANTIHGEQRIYIDAVFSVTTAGPYDTVCDQCSIIDDVTTASKPSIYLCDCHFSIEMFIINRLFTTAVKQCSNAIGPNWLVNAAIRIATNGRSAAVDSGQRWPISWSCWFKHKIFNQFIAESSVNIIKDFQPTKRFI